MIPFSFFFLRRAKTYPFFRGLKYDFNCCCLSLTCSQLPSDDAYSHLRYDPNWRSSLKVAGLFNESPHTSSDEYYQILKEEGNQACGDTLVLKGGYRCVHTSDTGPAAVTTPHMAGNKSDQPYHLHPQDGQQDSVTYPYCQNRALQLRSPETDHLRASSIFSENQSDDTSQRGFRKKCKHDRDKAAENIRKSLDLTKDENFMYMPQSDSSYQQELIHIHRGPTHKELISTSALWGPKAIANKKQERLKEDIVERNKTTLGRNTSKSGSYVTMHALKHDMPHVVNKVCMKMNGLFSAVSTCLKSDQW